MTSPDGTGIRPARQLPLFCDMALAARIERAEAQGVPWLEEFPRESRR